MANQRNLNALRLSLTDAIEKWQEECAEKDEWGSVLLVGENSAELMAKAAMSVLESSIDVQEYLHAQGMMKDD